MQFKPDLKKVQENEYCAFCLVFNKGKHCDLNKINSIRYFLDEMKLISFLSITDQINTKVFLCL